MYIFAKFAKIEKQRLSNNEDETTYILYAADGYGDDVFLWK